MHILRTAPLAVVLAGVMTAPAFAQRLPFERSFDVAKAPSLDVNTIRGKIDVTVGEPGRIVVAGTVTVRVGLDVPANAVEIARRVADHPPIERDGQTIRLHPPIDPEERRAVTVSYQVAVPPETAVTTTSDSGATSVQRVSGPVAVRTQSGAIELKHLNSTATVATGSGAVSIDGVADRLTVKTSSSGITARGLKGDVHLRTNSGAVDVDVVGGNGVDVETGSSSITLRGAHGALTAVTESGRVRVQGVPQAPWTISTGSGGVEVALDAGAALQLEAESGSGSISFSGAAVQGAVSKRRASGTIGGGGSALQVKSRSGSIRFSIGANQPARREP